MPCSDPGPLGTITPDDRSVGDWLVWQLTDSAFPVGGFGHSGGLEAAWQAGEVADGPALEAYLTAGLRQLATAALPLVRAAHREPHALAQLDASCEAWIVQPMARRASRLQGRAFWMAVCRALLADSSPAPDPGHLAPVFGALLRRLGLSESTTARMFAFQHLRGQVSAAVRLGLIGPLEAQAIQQRLAGAAECAVAMSVDRSLDDLAVTAPLIDLWQSAQDRLYSRLFQS